MGVADVGGVTRFRTPLAAEGDALPAGTALPQPPPPPRAGSRPAVRLLQTLRQRYPCTRSLKSPPLVGSAATKRATSRGRCVWCCDRACQTRLPCCGHPLQRHCCVAEGGARRMSCRASVKGSAQLSCVWQGGKHVSAEQRLQGANLRADPLHTDLDCHNAQPRLAQRILQAHHRSTTSKPLTSGSSAGGHVTARSRGAVSVLVRITATSTRTRHLLGLLDRLAPPRYHPPHRQQHSCAGWRDCSWVNNAVHGIRYRQHHLVIGPLLAPSAGLSAARLSRAPPRA